MGLSFVRTNGKIVYPIDLMQMKQKAGNSDYKSFFELRNDLSWFIHNCKILHSTKPGIMGPVNELEKFVDDEIFSIYACPECYSNASTHPDGSIEIPCQKMHPVIWAKSNDYSYWPAKVMACNNDTVVVEYFAEHTIDNIPLQNCFKFSPQPPEKNETENDTLYAAALKVYMMNCLFILNFTNSNLMF